MRVAKRISVSSFLSEIIDYVLKKEEEAAKKHKMDADDIQKQIDYLKSKREEIEKDCKEEKELLESTLEKMHWIHAYAIECKDAKDNNA